jgi:CHAT domain-containing protein
VVWCPTGPLALLPVHAAGYHDDHAAGRSTLDLVISSYTSSLHAMPHRHRAEEPGRGLIVVAVPDTHGLPALPGAQAEVTALVRDFPSQITETLVGPAADRAAVLRALTAGGSVHFACHGSQDVDAPANGAIHVADGPVTITDIAALRLRQAEFAYLSACQTATGGAELPDEAIHLAAALQLAGFRRVVGTLWPISDRLSADVARRTYEGMLTPSGDLDATRSAAALHHAVRDLRAARPHEPTRWAPYIHFGA